MTAQVLQADRPGWFARFEGVKAVRIACIVIVAFLVLYPLFWLVLGSVLTSPRGGAPTLAAYVEVLNDPYFGEVVWNTALLAIGSTVLAVLIGAPIAWIVARTDTPLKPLFHLLALVPFITPPILFAIAWSYLGSPNSGAINLAWMALTGSREPLINIYTMPGLIWVMGLSLTPYVFVFTSMALEHMDPALEHASYISGSGPLSTTLRVTLPLMAPAILSGALLVFIQSLEIFAIPATIGTPGGIYVFVTQIYELLRGVPPKYAQAAALSVPLLITCGLALWLQMRMIGRGKSYTTVGGKSFRPKLIKLGPWRYLALAYATAYMLFSAVLPYLLFVYGAFIKSSGMAPKFENFTTRYFVEFFTGSTSSMMFRAIWNSMLLSVVGALIALVLSAGLAYFIQRSRGRLSTALDFLALLPLAVPGAVLAIGLLWAYIQPPFELYGTLTILLIAYVTRHIPYGVRAVSSSLAQVSQDLEKAARISGATWSRTFRTVLVPVLIPGLMSGWVLMFVSMMRELSASIMLFGSGTETIAVALYLLWDEALFQQVSILSLVIILLSLVPIGLLRLLAKSTRLSGA